MKIKTLFGISIVCIAISACVPAKKFKELAEKERVCSEELEKYKRSSLDYESKAKEYQVLYDVLTKDMNKMKKDTTILGARFRDLQREHKILLSSQEALEKSFETYKSMGSKETSALQKQLEAKTIEVQRKSDALLDLEAELKSKQKLLEEREKRVNELEEAIRKKDAGIQLLKAKVANALRGFENKGLTVVQKNGKIYVSLEAKLLFKSGSTFVEPEGRDALIQLGQVLESEKDLEIVVEGHTDTDKLSSPNSPKNNWELSVLRATSVVEILLANSTMSPIQVMAAGRGEFHPVDVNDKAKNRRIEVIISPNLNELFEIISND